MNGRVVLDKGMLSYNAHFGKTITLSAQGAESYAFCLGAEAQSQEKRERGEADIRATVPSEWVHNCMAWFEKGRKYGEAKLALSDEALEKLRQGLVLVTEALAEVPSDMLPALVLSADVYAQFRRFLERPGEKVWPIQSLITVQDVYTILAGGDSRAY